MSLTREQQKREADSRAELERNGWTVDAFEEERAADELAGLPAVARHVRVSQAFGPHAVRRVFVGSYFTAVLEDVRRWREEDARRKPEFRLRPSDGAIPVFHVAAGDTAQRRNAQKGGRIHAGPGMGEATR